MKLPFKIISRSDYDYLIKVAAKNVRKANIILDLKDQYLYVLTPAQKKYSTGHQLKNILKRFGVAIEPVHKHTKSLNTKEKKAIMNYMNSCGQSEVHK